MMYWKIILFTFLFNYVHAFGQQKDTTTKKEQISFTIKTDLISPIMDRYNLTGELNIDQLGIEIGVSYLQNFLLKHSLYKINPYAGSIFSGFSFNIGFRRYFETTKTKETGKWRGFIHGNLSLTNYTVNDILIHEYSAGGKPFFSSNYYGFLDRTISNIGVGLGAGQTHIFHRHFVFQYSIGFSLFVIFREYDTKPVRSPSFFEHEGYVEEKRETYNHASVFNSILPLGGKGVTASIMLGYRF